MIFSNFENNYLPIQQIFIADYQRAKGFPCGSAGKESVYNVGDLGSIPGSGRSPGEGKGYPLQYSGLENSMDCIVYAVAKSRTQLSDFHFTTKQQRAFQVALLLLLLLLLSHFSRVRLCVTLQTAPYQAPQTLGFSRQEHQSGLPFPSPMHESEK